MKASTAALADAIGIGKKPRAFPSTTALAEALTKFSRSVAAYGRQLAAECDEDDEASLTRFVKAVAPIDAHRLNMRSGGSDPDAPLEPSAPAQPSQPAAPTPPSGAAQPSTPGQPVVSGPTTDPTPTPNAPVVPAPVVT